MNKKIRQLAEQVGQGDPFHIPPEFIDKFARLIVKECAEIANDHNSEVEGVTLGVGRALKKHFGIIE